ncbi:sensor domain-containing protein [Pseudobacillus wudalianchiensis]|uniref:PAS domain S-box protein n=1 Tax=Pseudobacillus wudalianchiensis TaxID=1743143 RepID=A0A1B9AMS4_9BACI|nr:EAL domain-containing protein [Bacillus wudalianchiensis]OCA85149.1 hypothetical protein A8F95_10740 [Bacillus wudalianchiensis]
MVGYSRSVYDDQPELLLMDLQQLHASLSKFDVKQRAAFERLDSEVVRFIRNHTDLLNAVDQAVIIGITDTKGRILYVNDSFCKISKYVREELIGKNHRLINSSYHPKAFFKDMWDTIASGKVWRGQVRNKAKNGEHYWVQTTIVPIKDEKGEVSCHIALRTDISKGKFLEEKLRMSIAEDYDRTIKLVNHLVFKLKKNDRDDIVYSYINGGIVNLFKKDHMKQLNKSLHSIYPKEQASFFLEHYEKAFRGESISYKYKIGKLWLFTSLTPVERDGQIVEVVGTTSDVTDLEKMQEKVHFMAYHDDMTKLPNRMKLLEDLDRQMKGREPFTAFYLDMNNFKTINDSIGYKIGDKLIILAGQRIKEFFKQSAMVYRVGGDEFFVVWRDSDKIESTVTELLDQLSLPFVIDSHEISISFSLGISHFPELSQDVESVLQHTHLALQKSKQAKENNFVFYKPELYRQYQQRAEMEKELRSAIDSSELTLLYQPKMDSKTNKMIGVEALVRWQSPKYGMVSPGRFIPLAEETGLISRIGKWVLTEACKQMKEWLEKGYPAIRMAVNISANELQSPNFVQQVEEILQKTGVNPSCLELEITENSMLSQQSGAVLNELRKLGIYLSIDDFGTGYSSLSYLKTFPVDCLKIDQNFIFDVFKDSGSAEIVKVIIQIAHTFNLNVIAEGVENRKTVNFLLNNKCNQVQGYFYSKPVSPRTIERFWIESFQGLNN